MYLLFFLISFFASVIGAICGIGGGVIIKPALDAFHVLSVPAISFLSGCTVLSMSAYSLAAGKKEIEGGGGIRGPLALGAAGGGLLGRLLFQAVLSLFPDTGRIGAVQAAFLLALTLGTMIYTCNKGRIRTRRVSTAAACVFIGGVLGIISAFLGIGGGPFNLVALSYFFSLDTKAAAGVSLHIIFFSQAASMINALATRSIPAVSPMLLAVMAAAGISGGILGRRINKKIGGTAVDRLFMALLAVLMGICIFNIVQYSS